MVAYVEIGRGCVRGLDAAMPDRSNTTILLREAGFCSFNGFVVEILLALPVLTATEPIDDEGPLVLAKRQSMDRDAHHAVG